MLYRALFGNGHKVKLSGPDRGQFRERGQISGPVQTLFPKCLPVSDSVQRLFLKRVPIIGSSRNTTRVPGVIHPCIRCIRYVDDLICPTCEDFAPKSLCVVIDEQLFDSHEFNRLSIKWTWGNGMAHGRCSRLPCSRSTSQTSNMQ